MYRNKFALPEIIYDPTLVLSPHVFLLGMLFHIKAFKDRTIDCPEKLYRLNVLKNKNEQRLPLRDDLADKFVFCEAVQQGEIVQLTHELRLSNDKVNYRMKKSGEITGFAQVAKPYVLRNGAAKAFNESRMCLYFVFFWFVFYSHLFLILTRGYAAEVSDSLQNLMLQHSTIDTFLKHYLDRNITADVMSIYRGLEPQKAVMSLLCSMSRSIDPRRPWKLTTEESKSVNDLPPIKRLEKRRNYAKARRDSAAAGEQYELWDDRFCFASRELNNEKQQARAQLKRDKLDQFDKEQPVIDSERQLSGKVVDEEVKSVLERTEFMTSEHFTLVDAIMTLPGKSWDLEQQRRITAINAVTMYCGVEEGSACFPSQPAPVIEAPAPIERPPCQAPESVQRAVRSVMTEKRPKICFLCLQNTKLRFRQRIHSYYTAGELTKHFERKHLKKFQRLNCELCKVAGKTLADILDHAEEAHGTVTRNPKYRVLRRCTYY